MVKCFIYDAFEEGFFSDTFEKCSIYDAFEEGFIYDTFEKCFNFEDIKLFFGQKQCNLNLYFWLKCVWGVKLGGFFGWKTTTGSITERGRPSLMLNRRHLRCSQCPSSCRLTLLNCNSFKLQTLQLLLRLLWNFSWFKKANDPIPTSR